MRVIKTKYEFRIRLMGAGNTVERTLHVVGKNAADAQQMVMDIKTCLWNESMIDVDLKVLDRTFIESYFSEEDPRLPTYGIELVD